VVLINIEGNATNIAQLYFEACWGTVRNRYKIQDRVDKCKNWSFMDQLLTASDQKLWIKIGLHYYTFTVYTINLNQPSGIRFQASQEMRLSTLFGSHCKHCFSYNISVLSALEVLMTMRYVNRHLTYLFTKNNYKYQWWNNHVK